MAEAAERTGVRRRASSDDDLFGGRLAVVQAVFGVVALLAGATILVGAPEWASAWIRDRVLAPDAAAAGVPFEAAAIVVVVGAMLTALAFLAAAALIYWRRTRSSVALLIVVTLLLRAAWFAAGLDTLADRLGAWSGPIAIVRSLDGICALLFLLVFPTGRFVPRSAMYVWVGWTALVLGTLATPAFSPIYQLHSWWAAALTASLALYGLGAQLYRYRRVASRYQRLQTKWITYGLSIYVLTFSLVELLPVVFPALLVPSTATHFWYVVLGSLGSDLAGALVPATILIAVFRAGFLDIDLIINRTVTYFATTAVLAGVFAGLSSGAQYVLGQVTGHGSDQLSIVIALGVGLTFAPVKTYFQRAVDRRLRPAQ
jgi:hypothetical protein